MIKRKARGKTEILLNKNDNIHKSKAQQIKQSEKTYIHKYRVAECGHTYILSLNHRDATLSKLYLIVMGIKKHVFYR